MFVQDILWVEGACVSLLGTVMVSYHHQSRQHMLIKCFTVFAHDLLDLFSLMCLIKKESNWKTMVATHTWCQLLKTKVLSMRSSLFAFKLS